MKKRSITTVSIITCSAPGFYFIFNIVCVDFLTVMLSSMKNGCNINDISFNNLVYADDTVHIASPPELLKIISFLIVKKIKFCMLSEKC